jgi:(1->4)-alpha-D-glucan 1-alpha-D-glucosylmutase
VRLFTDPPARPVAVARFQQLSAPVAAKSVEDTAFYRYGRLLSRNDVGFDVETFALDAASFHTRVLARAAHHPHAMLATATHDHKRGEDVRARLAVLSGMAEEWAAPRRAGSSVGAPAAVARRRRRRRCCRPSSAPGRSI